VGCQFPREEKEFGVRSFEILGKIQKVAFSLLFFLEVGRRLAGTERDRAEKEKANRN
jgi:hypothetical protein